MHFSHFFALLVLFSYFTLIVALFSVILRSLPLPKQGLAALDKRAYVFGGLAVASLLHTWTYMFKFMANSYHLYIYAHDFPHTFGTISKMSDWLVNTSLFADAWSSVCADPLNWWWSEQLCLYTVGAWTVFLTSEGYRSSIKYPLAYMLLGQLVAISVASSLFFLALTLHASHSPLQTLPKERNQRLRAAPALYVPITLALLTTLYSPYTSTETGTFLPNLLTMHALLLVPLLVTPSSAITPSSFARNTITLPTFYFILSLGALFLRLRTTIALNTHLGTLGSKSIYESVALISETLHSTPEQSSIGWDVLWTSLSFVVWSAVSAPVTKKAVGYDFGSRLLELPVLALKTALVSVGVSGAEVLGNFEKARSMPSAEDVVNGGVEADGKAKVE